MPEELITTFAPEGLEERPSEIHGRGLFATIEFEPDHVFGVSHIPDERFKDGYARTYIGALYNHTPTDPNAVKVEKDGLLWLVSSRLILPDDEILVTYTMYDPTENR